MSVKFAPEVVYDPRLDDTPNAVDFVRPDFNDFFAVAADLAEVHLDAVETLRIAYSARRPKGRLGYYNIFNQTAIVYVTNCIEEAAETGVPPEVTINSTTLHEVGHHLVPLRLRGALGYAAGVGGTILSLYGLLGTQLNVYDRASLVCASAGVTSLLLMAQAMNEATPECDRPGERIPCQLEQLFSEQYQVVRLRATQ